MELLWAADAPCTVADVHQKMGEERELAYTTVMTVLDRLAKKGMTTRELVGRAWQYRPAEPQHVVAAKEMAALLEPLDDEVRRAAVQEFLRKLPDDDRAALAG